MVMIHGSCVALLTPFTEAGGIDFEALAKIVAWHIAEGTHALVPCGTTGESATLTTEEHEAIVSFVIKESAGKIPVIAGTGSNNTAEAIALTQHAEQAGATAALLITPYYNKPTQEGVYQHTKAIHDASTLPLILYDVPGRTVTRIDDETLYRLAELPRVRGLKDATNDVARPLRHRRRLGDDFCLLSGEDATTLAYLLNGGNGSISVTANVAPRWCADLFHAWKEGNLAEAQAINRRLCPLSDALFLETNPGPVKWLAGEMGLCRPAVRLPLVLPTVNVCQALRHVQADIGLQTRTV
jgi:4-hydroxy-tetrahydrodipicolinate synthase